MSEELKRTSQSCINTALEEQLKQEFSKIIDYVNQYNLAYAKDAKDYVDIGLLYSVAGDKIGNDRFRVQTMNQAVEVMEGKDGYQAYRYF